MTSPESAVVDEILGTIEAEMAANGGKAPINILEAQEAATKTVNEGQVLYSTLFGDPPSGTDHAVTVFKDEDWPEYIRQFIPKPMPTYEPQPKETEKLVVALETGDKTILTGPTGSGKSSLVRYVCSVLRRPFIRINMTGDMESAAFFGSLTVEIDTASGHSHTVWKDGPMAEAVIEGAVILVDEWDVSPPEIMMGLQWLLEDDGELHLKEKPASAGDQMYIPHEQFRIVCGGNTLGQGDETGSHAGVAVQNSATLDRFQTVIKLDYLGKRHELKILKKTVPDLNTSVAQKMQQFANLVRTAYKQTHVSLTMSPRTLINWGRKTVYWGDPLLALKISYYDKIMDSEKGVIDDLINKVFGSKI